MTTSELTSSRAERPMGLRVLGAIGFLMVAGIVSLAVTFLTVINPDRLDVEIAAFDPATGATLWSTAFGVKEAPVFGEVSIVTVVGGGVEALNSAGDVAWFIRDGRARRVQVAFGVVYITTTGGDGAPVVLAVDEVSGEELWRLDDQNVHRLSDGLAILHREEATTVVESSTGAVLAAFTDNLRDTAFPGDSVALLLGRSLWLVTVENGERRLASKLPNSKIVAANADLVVLDHPSPDDDLGGGRRRRVLTVYDVATGDVRWQRLVAKYDQASVVGGNLRLIRRDGAVELDRLDGRDVSVAGFQPPPDQWLKANKDGTEVIIHRAILLSGSGATHYIIPIETIDDRERGSTIAVDAATGAVRWVRDVPPVAVGGSVVVVDDGNALVALEAASGKMLAEVVKQQRWGAVGVGDAVLIVSGSSVITVGANGSIERLEDVIQTRSSIVVATEGVLVMDRFERFADGPGKRVMTAYELPSGEVLWTQQLSRYETAEIVGQNLRVTQNRGITEINLNTGVQTVLDNEAPDEKTNAQRSVVVAFDAGMTELLWVGEFPSARSTSLGVVDDVVVVFGQTFRNQD